jgi:hypothetical protein
MRFSWPLFAFVLLAVASAQSDGAFYAYARAAETNVFLGQVFNVDVIVHADQKPDAPSLAGLEKFHAALLTNGQPTSESNTWLYRYAFRAKHEGRLQIPTLRFGKLFTAPVEIHAKKPVATSRMELMLELSKTSVYQGEPVLLTATWDSTYPFGAIKAVDLSFPVLNDRRFEILDLYNPDKDKQKSATGLPVQGTRVLATRKSFLVGETQHQSLSFAKILIPKTGGTLAIPPATLLCAAEDEADPKGRRRQRAAFQYPAYFDNTFFDQNVAGDSWSRIYVESAAPVLEVKPLPIAGRPSLFNGMVGEFGIEVTAEPSEVSVGEPVTLTITITSTGFAETIFFPSLRYQPMLVNRFEIPADRSLPVRSNKSKTYTQTIRPLSTDVDSIPPIQLAYFSPESNAYVSVKSSPIPLKVLPAEEIGIFGVNIHQSRLQTAEGGIRHNHEGPELLEHSRTPLFGTRPFIALALLLLPPLAMGVHALASIFGKKRHHIQRTAKAVRAYRVFRRNVAHIIHSHSRKSAIYGDLDPMLRAYLGDRLHLNPGALSFRDAKEQLAAAGAEPRTLEELERVFTLCEAYRFARCFDEKGDARTIVRNAVETVKAVERTLK